MKRHEAKELLVSGVLQAWAGGRTIQFLTPDSRWVDLTDSECHFTLCPSDYRVKPDTVLVPLTQDDIPRVCYIREPGSDDHWIVWGVTPTELRYGSNNRVPYKHLHDYKWSMSTDRVTWAACSKAKV